MHEIPAIISDLSDEEAEEIAITENLQRKDVTPMEEANAYQRLMESGRHDLSSLSVQFGKSEAYIRTRRSEEHTSELQSRQYLVCRLLLEKKKTTPPHAYYLPSSY